MKAKKQRFISIKQNEINKINTNVFCFSIHFSELNNKIGNVFDNKYDLFLQECME